MPEHPPLREYLVTWSIPVAEPDPRRAIAQAIDWMQRPDSPFRVFEVSEVGSRRAAMTIDLDDENDLTGQKVWGRKDSEFADIFAIATGATRPCQLHGCGQRRIAVRWPSGRITYPCRDDLELRPEGYRIR